LPGPLRIVVVEDDNLIAELVSDLVKLMGHSVCAVVATEPEAIVAARTHNPDLMIVDELLRFGSGSKAMAAILNERHMPHLYATSQFIRLRQELPDAIVIAKPFRANELLVAIQQALQAK
jgi:CheY-like chemotaxis protein